MWLYTVYIYTVNTYIVMYSIAYSEYRVFQDWCEWFPTGIATTKITLELGQIHCCFKTAPRKPRTILHVLAASPRLDLQGIHVITNRLRLLCILWVCVTKTISCLHEWTTMKTEYISCNIRDFEIWLGAKLLIKKTYKHTVIAIIQVQYVCCSKKLQPFLSSQIILQCNECNEIKQIKQYAICCKLISLQKIIFFLRIMF